MPFRHDAKLNERVKRFFKRLNALLPVVPPARLLLLECRDFRSIFEERGDADVVLVCLSFCFELVDVVVFREFFPM